MQPNPLNCPGRRGRFAARRLAFLLLPLTLAALTAACPSDNTNPTFGGYTEPSTGAEDRPIVITGGSLNVFFNHAAFAAVGDASTQPQKFRLAGYRLAGMRAYNDEGAENSSVICDQTLGDNTTVTVTYTAPGPGASPGASPSPGTSPSPGFSPAYGASPGASPGGGPPTKQLTVTSGVGPDGRSFVELTMDTSANSLPPRPATRNMHYNRSARLEGLSHGPTSGATTQCAPLPPNRRVTVEINVARVATPGSSPARR